MNLNGSYFVETYKNRDFSEVRELKPIPCLKVIAVLNLD